MNLPGKHGQSGSHRTGRIVTCWLTCTSSAQREREERVGLGQPAAKNGLPAGRGERGGGAVCGKGGSPGKLARSCKTCGCLNATDVLPLIRTRSLGRGGGVIVAAGASAFRILPRFSAASLRLLRNRRNAPTAAILPRDAISSDRAGTSAGGSKAGKGHRHRERQRNTAIHYWGGHDWTPPTGPKETTK